jgi:tRNA 2-thiouridine synthesizing protein A
MSRTWFGRRVRTGGGIAVRATVPVDRPVADSQGVTAPPPPAAAVRAAEQTALTIDALGRKCPIPIIMLAEQIGDVPVGAIVAVLADDPAAYTDIPAWCVMKSHECAYRFEYATGWSFGIRRSY